MPLLEYVDIVLFNISIVCSIVVGYTSFLAIDYWKNVEKAIFLVEDPSVKLSYQRKKLVNLFYL